MPLRSMRAPLRLAPPTRSAPRLRLAVLALAVWTGASAYAQTPGAARPAADPAAVEDAFDDARVLYDAALFGPAAQAFARFLDRYPRDARAPDALFFRAQSALQSGDAGGAGRLFAQFERDHPSHPLAPRARLAIGRYAYDTGDYEAAEAALLDALARPGPAEQTAPAAYLLGQTYRALGRPDAAVSAFEQAAVDDTPTAPEALYAAGVVSAEVGDAAAAASAFERLAQRYPASPANADVGLGLAEAYLRLGRRPAALRELDARRPQLSGDAAARADLLRGETRLVEGDAAGAVAPLEAVPEGRYRRRAALALGRAALAEGDATRAAEYLAAVRTGAADGLAHEATYYEGLSLAQTGQLGEAEARLAEAADGQPPGPYADAALLELGLLRYTRRRYNEAAEAFSRLLDTYPQSPNAGEAARMLGESYAALGDTERARQAYRRAEALGTATSETRAEIAFQDAYALFQAERYDEATDALLAVAGADPAGPRAGEALFWAGESAFRSGDLARAEFILDDYVGRFPDHRQADAGRYVLAWTHFRRRDYAAAADGFERFLSAYTRSSEAVPYYADALLRLADSYYALGRFDEARQVYARVPDATPDRQGGDYALYQSAQAFGNQGRTDDALAAYARLLTDYPGSGLYAQALVAQGALLSARGDDDAAIAAYQRVLAERPASAAGASALLGIGDVQSNLGRYAEAEAAYRRALERYPDSPVAPDALDGLTAALDAQGRRGEIDAVVADIEGRVTDPAALARLRLARARSALGAGQDSLAVVQLETLLGAGVQGEIEEEALLTLAGAYASTGRPADGARALRRLLTRYPDSPLAPEAQLQLAEALLAAGDAEAARSVAAGYGDAFPDDAERVAAALALEARALDALGQPDAADARRRRLVAQYPDSAAAQAALRDRPDLASPPDEDADDQ